MIFLWVPCLLLAFFALSGAALLLYCCGRRRLPEFWDASVLLRMGAGSRRGAVQEGKAWLEAHSAETVETRADDDVPLRGLFLPQKVTGRGTVLLLHDVRSSWKLDCPEAAGFFFSRGYQVLLADGRAHGASGGRWTTYGIWERFDVRSWTEYLAQRFGETHRIWIYGVGMGGAAALMAAPLDLSGDVRGIMAESVYNSPWRFVNLRLGQHLQPLPAAPLTALLNLSCFLTRGFGLRDSSAEQGIRESEYPLLLLFAEKGELLAPEDIRNLAAANPGGLTTLFRAEGAQRGACWQMDRERLTAAVLAFLEKSLLEYI